MHAAKGKSSKKEKKRNAYHAQPGNESGPAIEANVKQMVEAWKAANRPPAATWRIRAELKKVKDMEHEAGLTTLKTIVEKDVCSFVETASMQDVHSVVAMIGAVANDCGVGGDALKDYLQDVVNKVKDRRADLGWNSSASPNSLRRAGELQLDVDVWACLPVERVHYWIVKKPSLWSSEKTQPLMDEWKELKAEPVDLVDVHNHEDAHDGDEVERDILSQVEWLCAAIARCSFLVVRTIVVATVAMVTNLLLLLLVMVVVVMMVVSSHPWRKLSSRSMVNLCAWELNTRVSLPMSLGSLLTWTSNCKLRMYVQMFHVVKTQHDGDRCSMRPEAIRRGAKWDRTSTATHLQQWHQEFASLCSSNLPVR